MKLALNHSTWGKVSFLLDHSLGEILHIKLVCTISTSRCRLHEAQAVLRLHQLDANYSYSHKGSKGTNSWEKKMRLPWSQGSTLIGFNCVPKIAPRTAIYIILLKLVTL